MWVRYMDQEDTLKESKATHLENPMDRGAWQARGHRVVMDWM